MAKKVPAIIVAFQSISQSAWRATGFIAITQAGHSSNTTRSIDGAAFYGD